MSALPVYMQMHHMCTMPAEARKRMSDPLKLELKTVVNIHMGVGTKPESSGRLAISLNHRVIFPAPQISFIIR